MDPHKNCYPCGYCHRNLTWNHKALCCDECNIWYHQSCLGLGIQKLNHSSNASLSWICCKCDTPNISSFTFHSYDLECSNQFINLADITDHNLDESLNFQNFLPNLTSSPKPKSISTTKSEPNDSSVTNNTQSPIYPVKENRTNLRILTINFQSLRNKIQELWAILDYIKPDVVCGTETWLDDTILDAELFPTHIYKPYRKDRNLKGGGVLILVRADIVSQKLTLTNNNCELCLVEIKPNKTKKYIVGSFYMPHRNSKSLKELRSNLDPLQKHNITICGDFNCPDIDWKQHIVHPGASDRSTQEELISLVQDFTLTQVHHESTRMNNILDLVITSNPSHIINSCSAPGLSDHDLVITDYKIKLDYAPSQKHTRHNFNKANWNSIKSYLASELTKLCAEDVPASLLWGKFKDHIKAAISKYIPTYVSKPKYSIPWLNPVIEKCLRKKNRLHDKVKKFEKSDPRWNKYKIMQKQCRKLMKDAEQEYINGNIISGLAQNNTKPLWRYIKSKKQDLLGISPLKKNGQLFSEALDKTEILLNKFEEVFTRPIKTPLPVINQLCPNIPTLEIKVKGVEILLQKIDINKATGPDGIPNIVLKNCAHEISPLLSVIFQKSLDSGDVPADWRDANVCAIFKKGDRHDANNYRPVSLTSVCSKLLEHIIHKHMIIHFDQHEILTERNHGFRKQYSCETQLITTIDDLTRSYDSKTQVDIAVLDFSKAFDKVPHRELLHKLRSYGIDGNIARWIESFLCQRTMRVVVEGTASHKIKVTSGVPQGTVLGPLLFLCHINDLPSTVNSQVRLFADDCLVYREIKCTNDHIALQSDLHALEKWSQKWGMSFNSSKCTVLSQNTKSSRFYTINGNILKNVSHTPYLGITISDDLKWDKHIGNVTSKANSTLGLLKRNLNKCPEDCKKIAYTALVRSKLEYGCTIWDPYTEKNIKEIEKVQRRGVRFITGNYVSRNPGDVTKMMKYLKLEPLQDRRKNRRLITFSNIVEKKIPSLPPERYLKPMKVVKRKIKAKTIENSVTTNIVQNSVNTNPVSFERIFCRTNQRSNSFFPRTIIEWNQLDERQINTLLNTINGPGGKKTVN